MVFVENLFNRAWKESAVVVPPFGIEIEVKEPWGAIRKAVFHKDEESATGLLDMPLKVHLIVDFVKSPITWRHTEQGHLKHEKEPGQ